MRLSHEELYNKTLLPAIRPLLDAAEANINLYYLENRSGEKKKWFDDAAPEFRMTACKTRFCETMTNLIKVLREHAGLIGVMNVIRSLNKF